MRWKYLLATLIGSVLALQSCGPAPTPAAQAEREHEIACLAGTVGGAVVGGAIGNAFGAGTGKDILTAAGAAGGAVTGNRFGCGA